VRSRLVTLLLSLLLLSAAGAKAQFATTGDNPDSLRWMERRTEAYRIIYPVGADSLAAEYERHLWENRARVAMSIGMMPGGLQWGRTPVLLHTRYTVANGSVTWAPKRMDFYTMPDPYRSEPTPWALQLAIHEQRHLAQMQLGYRGWFKPLTWVLGEMVPGALAGVYPGPALLEGDAVVAETGLTEAGRGRTGDFLMYYQLGYQQGDWRNFYQWRYGSLHSYAPDHYALGYLTLAGARVFYERPLLVKDYFDGVAKRPLRIGTFRKLLKETTGEKRFRNAFRAIQDQWQAEWTKEREARGPFQPMEQLSTPTRFATEYTDGAFLDTTFYVIKRGKVTPSTLITLDPESGKEQALHSFAGYTSRLSADPNTRRLYWSESVSDLRWGLGGSSRIRFYDPASGKTADLTRRGRFFNPAPSLDGTLIAAVEYPTEGGSNLVLLDAESGIIRDRLPAPDQVQLTETAWTPDGALYALGLTDGGFLILKRDGAQWEAMTPQPISAKVFGLSALSDGNLLFTSDLDGVDAGYRYTPGTGCVRITATPYGAANPRLTPDGTGILFESLTAGGTAIFRSETADLPEQEADLFTRHAYPVAEALSAQENALAFALHPSTQVPSDALVKRYRKLPHLLHLHSWAPFAFDYETIDSGSGDFYRDEIDPGVTLLVQNNHGNAYGMVNYAYHRNDLTDADWRHSAHARFTYTGLYPVLEANLSYNDRQSVQYYRRTVDQSGSESRHNAGFLYNTQSLQGSLTAYVPLNFSKGGWTRGLVPKLSYTLSNDIFARDRVDMRYEEATDDAIALIQFIGSEHFGGGVPVQSLQLSLRGYTYRPAAASQVYPSLGIGAEVGYLTRPGLTQFFTPAVYANLYGYLPGLVPQQGLRLSAAFEYRIGNEGRTILPEYHLNLYPRGFESAVGRLLANTYDTGARLSAEYAIPFEWGHMGILGPVAYVHHYTLSPHFDLMAVNGGETLYSAGITLSAALSNFFWAPFDGSIGLSVCYNGGSLFDAVSTALYENKLERISTKISYSMDF